MTFTAPVTEQRFVLEHVAGLPALLADPRFAEVDEQLVDAVLDGAAAFAQGELAPLNQIGDRIGAQWDDGVVTLPPGFREAYRAYVEGGWGTLTAPAEFGGQGLPMALGVAVYEGIGAANTAFSSGPMLTMGASELLAHHASDDLKQAYLPQLVSGEWLGTMNLTEPQAGSDVGALRCAATPAADGTWRIKGTKIFITFGEHDLSDNIIHLVLARTPGAPAGTRGISLFLVPKVRLDGTRNDLRCAGIEHKLGMHASPTCTMVYGDDDDCHGWLVGEEHGGIRAMFTMMNSARINVARQGIEIAERATQQAVAYARERVQSARASDPQGGPVAIIEHPDVRRMLMRMQAQTQAIRALIYLAAGKIDRAALGIPGASERVNLLIPLAKAHATDVGCEVASLAIQVHGGMGFIEETGVAQHLRDIRIAPIYEGTNGIQAADLVGRKLAGDGGAALRALVADVLAETTDANLGALTREVARLAEELLAASVDDRLAASVPFLTMVSTMVCGWLMERQGKVAAAELGAGAGSAFLRSKVATARWYLRHMVPEAAGLAAQVRQGGQGLFEPDAFALAG